MGTITAFRGAPFTFRSAGIRRRHRVVDTPVADTRRRLPGPANIRAARAVVLQGGRAEVPPTTEE
jgi:hypothetical protein